MLQIAIVNVLWLSVLYGDPAEAFLQIRPTSFSAHRTRSAPRSSREASNRLQSPLFMGESSFHDSDDEDDDLIDPDSLGDWRAFRRRLAADTTERKERIAGQRRKSVSKENEELLETQSQALAQEYKTGLWAHETSTPEVGGLVVRMPLEVEIYRNYRHSMTGRAFRRKHTGVDESEPAEWYGRAQKLVEDSMLKIADKAGEDGQIDATTLDDEAAEMLQLYLDNQETWQEVCLVLDRDEQAGTATTLVLNRPMAMKLTENLAQLVYYGGLRSGGGGGKRKDRSMIKFMLAFAAECAVYIGGPDDLQRPAEMIHGIADLPGAVEISPGSRIYRGGLEAAIEGVLYGKYKPLDFRFFIGRHSFEESALDVSVVLGKYQPIACARSLALKQCISLPKPLWHEVLETCGGLMRDISQLEMLKRDDLRFQIVDDDDDMDEENYNEDDLPDEFDELEKFE